MKTLDPFTHRLSARLDAPEASLTFVHHHPGMRAARRILGATRGQTVLMSAPALPDRVARRQFRATLEAATGSRLEGEQGEPLGWESDWADLILALPRTGASTLVFDNVSGFMDARRSWSREVGRAWNEALRMGLPLRLVLVDVDGRTLEKLRASGSPFRHPNEALVPELAKPPGEWVPLETNHFGAVARACPDWSGDQVALGYGLLGATDQVLERLDPSVRVSTNVRRLLLAPEGPLFDRARRTLRTLFQNPHRYAGILRALALGGRDWKDIVAGLDGELPANALAPYVARLRDYGLIRNHRSLDAPLRSRKRRYALVDPADAFWWREVAPRCDPLQAGMQSVDEAWTRLRPRLDRYMTGEAPRLLRTLLARFSTELLGAPPREIGGLWGEGYDIPTAATLSNGAIVYAEVAWEASDVEPAFSRIEAGLRFTRYGYGREARLRVVLAREEPDAEVLRRVRRDPLKRLVTLEEVVQWARAS